MQNFFLKCYEDHKYKLPLLNAGVTPALISYVCSKLLNLNPVIVPLGIKVKPYFNHLVVEDRIWYQIVLLLVNR